MIRQNGKEILWEVGEKEALVERYINGTSINQIRQETGLHYSTICKILEEFNVQKRTRSTSHNNKLVNDCGIFENIDTHEKAYWLGVLSSDGYIGEKDCIVRLAMCDKDVVYNFADFFGVDRSKVKVTLHQKPRKDVYTLTLQDRRLNLSLRKLGITNNKSLILEPPLFLPEKFQLDFVRGYFDGDGGVSVSGQRRKIQIYFTGTFRMCEWILKVLNKDNLQPFPEHRSKGNNTYRITISGAKQIYSIAQKMYENSQQNNRMKRKFEIFQSYYDQSII